MIKTSKKPKICRNCNRSFIRSNYSSENWEKVKYCSIECRKNIKKPKRCLQCGEVFVKKGDYSIKEWEKKAKFCSKKCMNKYYTGKNSPHWKGGITELYKAIRTTSHYFKWKKAVLDRDKFCVLCGVQNNLHIDHIFPLHSIIKNNNITKVQLARECKELWNIENGRVLCEECHKKTDTYSKKKVIKTHKHKILII